MTKKDYKAIAKIVKENSCWIEEAYPKYIANALADYFEHNNPKFNREKFINACGAELWQN